MTKRKQAKIFCFNLQCCHLNSTSHLILLSFSDQIQPVSINLKGERAGGGGSNQLPEYCNKLPKLLLVEKKRGSYDALT